MSDDPATALTVVRRPEPALGALADGHRPTEAGNADRLVGSADGTIRYVHAWGKWIVYDGGRWRVDTKEVLVIEKAKQVPAALFRHASRLSGDDRDEMWKWAKASERASCIRHSVELARGMSGVLVGHLDLDRHTWLLNVANGTLDLRTGQLLDHNPEHLLTRQAPVIYDPAAEAPLWRACMQTWQPDPKVQAYLQRVIGSALSGHPVEEIIVNVGGGGNGKGKCFGACTDVLGPDYVVVPDKSLLVAQRHEGHPTAVARLFGARMVVAAETEAGDRLDEAKIKELTGGDLLEARRMREDPWQFKPSATWFLHTNYRPRIRGGDEGIWRRIRLVPWDVTIPIDQRDDRLAEKLAAEASGILNWMLEGCQAWQDEGTNPPPAIARATDGYRLEEDHVGRFLSETCTTDPNASTPASDLRAAYEQWCEEVGEKPWTAQALGRQLTARGLDTTRLGRDRERHWIGLRLDSEPQKQRGDRL